MIDMLHETSHRCIKVHFDFFPSNNIWQKNNIKKGNKIVFGIYITPELKDIEMCSRKEFKTQLIFLES